MGMLKRLLILLVIMTVAVALVGCPQQQPEEPEDQQGDNQQEAPEDIDVGAIVVEQWQQSGHAVQEGDSFTSAGSREGCAICHNGYAFKENTESLEGIGILEGASCDTCHIAHGFELMSAGTIDLPIGTIEGGTATLCIACHYGRGKEPNQDDAPHHSVQTDMLFAKAGAEVGEFDYGSSPHSAASNTCLACHMTPGENNVRDHLFKLNEANVEAACGQCHDYDSFNPKAAGDYDGNGTIEGIQDEVGGLLGVLEEAILNKLDGGKFVSSHGAIEFQDADGNALDAPPSSELYNAAWNYFFVEYDGSRGIHNPIYAIQLLQQSYKQVTGEDVPNADIHE